MCTHAHMFFFPFPLERNAIHFTICLHGIVGYCDPITISGFMEAQGAIHSRHIPRWLSSINDSHILLSCPLYKFLPENMWGVFNKQNKQNPTSIFL